MITRYDLGGIFISNTIAPEGTTVRINVNSTRNIISYTSVYPGVDPNGTVCNQLQQNIDTSLVELQQTLDTYQEEINSLVSATRALRSDRDRKELGSWSILQALGSITDDIERLETDINSLINIDFSLYET